MILGHDGATWRKRYLGVLPSRRSGADPRSPAIGSRRAEPLIDRAVDGAGHSTVARPVHRSGRSFAFLVEWSYCR